MLMKGCFIVTLLLLPEAFTQDATDTCNAALGVSSGDVVMTGPGSSPSAGRLDNADGAWCFSNDSIASQEAALRLDLGRKRFVAGFASQGPPEGVRPKTYNHLIAFSAAHSLDGTAWEEFNEGHLYFNVDKNDTSDVVIHHVSSNVELTRYVKINVTMHISGETTVCLRFEIYGCDTDVLPQTGVSASTTPKGKIEVTWQSPSVETTLGDATRTTGVLRPGGYAVLYRPLEAEDFASVATGERRVALEDVRLGATYLVRLRCLFRDVAVDCGSTRVEAYPPCPEDFTGGNEYHCFLHLGSVSSIQDARTRCLDSAFDHQLGSLGYLVDEDEKKFLVARILPTDTTSAFWLVGEACQENEECCTALKVEGDTLKEVPCSDKELTTALCLRDHKGEGARLRVSSVSASEDGSSARFEWRYEGTGWKTDELQVKVWTGEGEDSVVSSFSTLSQSFQLEAQVDKMYSVLLRPAPNIRTEEFVYGFVVIDFEEDTSRYGAVLTPVPMSIYIIWSGSLRVTWDEASALSVSGKAWPADKYSIMHRTTSPEAPPTQVEVAGGREFLLTPIAMRASYNFKMSCFFSGVFRPCGEISITTDPPDLVLYKPSKVYVIYEVIPDKPKSWSGAEDDCQQRSGHLTSLLDEAEAKAVLKMLPSEDAKMWTGAKLGKKGTGYWTDGEKITDLPMAKNSGVTSSSESCCRAIQEAGQLKLAGGHCEDRYPYICKYTVKEMLSAPGQLQATNITWNSFQLSWARPSKRWMPTFYNVQACLKASCIVRKQLKEKWTLKFQDLIQFQGYDLQVEAILQPVDVKTLSQTTVMTHPKSPVQVIVSPKGKGSVSCPVLTAMGAPDAKVTATLHQMETTFLQATGGVKDLPLTGLAPEETYKLVLKQDGGDWTHEVTFEAVPTCSDRDARRGTECYGLVEEAKSFEEARKVCSEATEMKAPPFDLWMPKSEADLKDVASDLGLYSDSWIKKPADGSLPEIGSDSSCSSGEGATCCFYDVSSSAVACSACCDRKLPFVCSYQIKEAYLGEVSGLLPSFVGNRSLSVEWSAPKDVSWQVERFEVEWWDVDAAGSGPEGKEVVAGLTEKMIEGLEYGTEYDVRVTPVGAKEVRGKTAKMLLTTLDPRQGVAVQIDSDGSARVYSPRMVEKGKGGEPVVVKLYRADGSKDPIATYDGQASKVDVNAELQVGHTYRVVMESKGGARPFQFDTEFEAYPSCQENQIQDGLVCLWPSQQTKSWTEAYEVCRGEDGELLDYKTQGELTQPVKALLTSRMQERFWLDMGAEGTAALWDADSSNCPSGQESEVMCCNYEVSETGELDNLKCSCCDEPRPFACKKNTNLNLGTIGNVVVEDVTSTSVTLDWTLASASRWGRPSYLVSYWESGRRRKRSQSSEREGSLVVRAPPAVVVDLKPATQYKIAVAPYTEEAKTSGEAKEISATTSQDINMASVVTGIGCTMLILKMSCCITVILGSSFTIFVFIATRMFYLDCLAQIFAEIATLGAYVCILVSSAQSYANDSECLTADRTLCVAVSVLIQFFFQVIYMFCFLEALVLCTTLKDYLPQCCAFRSHLSMSVCGFGFPAIMMIVLAAVASDGFSDGDDNCWLDLEGTAMLPSVIPVIVLATVSCLLLLSVFDAKEGLPSEQRGRHYLKTRWGCFVLLVWTSVCYACGLIGVNQRDPVLNYVFVGFSMSLGILMPIVRIRCDDEVLAQLKRGLFSSLKDDLGAIRVSPAPAPLLEMSEFERRKFKQKQQLDDDISREEESVYHR